MYREKHKRETGEELPHDYFPRLTVVFDEANNAQQAFERIYSGAKRRLDPWRCLRNVSAAERAR